MAGLICRVPILAPIALAAATAKTVLQGFAPTNQRIKALRFRFTLDGVNANAIPILVQIYRQTGAGTGGTATTPRLIHKGFAETPQSTWLYNIATTEPTYGDLLYVSNIAAYNGVWEDTSLYERELDIEGAGRLGLVATAPAAINLNGFAEIEE